MGTTDSAEKQLKHGDTKDTKRGSSVERGVRKNDTERHGEDTERHRERRELRSPKK
jgi:hypothetical protein